MATKSNSPVDEEAIRKNLKDTAASIDALMPHLNKAQAAFGNVADLQGALNDLKNKVIKAQSVYGQ